MLKEISTYGALLLTALVVYRASSLEGESTETKQLYQREADADFSSANSLLRSEIAANLYTTSRPNLIASFASAKQQIFETSHESMVKEIPSEDVSLMAQSEPSEISTNMHPEEDLSLSLDRESTITRSLSIYAPRQRIQPKPSME